MTNKLLIANNIASMIFIVRGQKVMLDNDLADLYQVETKALNRAVKRNIERFPDDFMFQLSKKEWEALKVRCRIVTSPKGGGRQYLPYVFTEQGVSMLSSVLASKQAITINVQIMRTFIKMRQFALENKDLSERQIAMVEKYLIQYAKDNSAEIDKINEAINYLLDITKPAEIGFKI
jgi:hypothetical protein